MTRSKILILTQLVAWLVLSEICLAANQANQMDRPETIRILIEPHADPQVVLNVVSTVFQVALQHSLDVKLRVTDSGRAPEWSPAKALSMSDVTTSSLASKVFRNARENELTSERQARLDSAVKQVGDYLNRYTVYETSCVKLGTAAQEIASEDFQFNILVVGGTICASPKMSVKLASSRRLVVVLAGRGPQNDDDDACGLVSQNQRIRVSFPKALVTPVADADRLARLLLSHSVSTESRVVVHGCEPTGDTASPTVRTFRHESPVIQNFVDPAPDSLRIVSPRHRSGVPRLVPFHGEGAEPGVDVFPVVRVGDEFFPQEPVRARADGTYDGTIIIGRPLNDCGQKYELRVFAQLRQEIKVGLVVGSWPAARSKSIPVELTRTEECGTRGQ